MRQRNRFQANDVQIAWQYVRFNPENYQSYNYYKLSL